MIEAAGGILLALVAIPVFLFIVLPILGFLVRLAPLVLAVGVIAYFVSHI